MSRSSRAFALACAITVGTLAACDHNNPTTPVEPTTGTGSGSIRVVNATTRSIFFVYLSPCSSTDWGTDRLGSNTIIAGTSKQWDALPAGCWDAKAVLDNDLAAERRGINVTSGSVFAWTPAATSFARVTTPDAGGVALSISAKSR